MRTFLCLSTALLAVCLFQAEAQTQEKRKVFVSNLTIDEPSLFGAANQQFLTAVTGSYRYFSSVTVVGMDDVRDILELQKMQQLLGCETENCQIDIARAVNAKTVFTGSISRNGQGYTLTIKGIAVNDKDFTVTRRGQANFSGDIKQAECLFRLLLENSKCLNPPCLASIDTVFVTGAECRSMCQEKYQRCLRDAEIPSPSACLDDRQAGCYEDCRSKYMRDPDYCEKVCDPSSSTNQAAWKTRCRLEKEAAEKPCKHDLDDCERNCGD